MIVTFTGMSGSGKDFLASKLGYKLVKSVTTRSPRKGEIPGVHYDFVTDEEFDKLLAEDAFAEKTKYVGNSKRYGALKQTVMDIIESGEDAYFVCDVEGYNQLKEKYPEHVIGFYIYATPEECEEGMRQRGDSEELIQERMVSWTYEHAVNSKALEYVIHNDRSKPYEETIALIKSLVAQRRL